jgi:hypothetical protein
MAMCSEQKTKRKEALNEIELEGKEKTYCFGLALSSLTNFKFTKGLKGPRWPIPMLLKRSQRQSTIITINLKFSP